MTDQSALPKAIRKAEKKADRRSLVRQFFYPLLAIFFDLAVLAMHLGAQWQIEGADGIVWVDTEICMVAMFMLVYGALQIDPPTGLFGDGADRTN